MPPRQPAGSTIHAVIGASLLLFALHAAVLGEQPAAARAPAADSPKEAVRRCMLAFASPDPVALRDAVAPDSKLESDVLDVWAGNVAAQNRLMETVRRRFGEKAAADLAIRIDRRPRGDAAAAAVDKVVRALEVSIAADGKSATLVPAGGGATVNAHLTDRGWKIAFASVFPGGADDPDRLRRYHADNHYMPPVFNALADEVAAGRVPADADLFGILTDRLAAASDAARPASDTRPLNSPPPGERR